MPAPESALRVVKKGDGGSCAASTVNPEPLSCNFNLQIMNDAVSIAVGMQPDTDIFGSVGLACKAFRMTSVERVLQCCAVAGHHDRLGFVFVFGTARL